MLVLSRRAGESIVIGGEIVVTLLEVRGAQARIGIEAPRSVSVHRKEVHDELERTNSAATSTSTADLGRLPKPGGSAAS